MAALCPRLIVTTRRRARLDVHEYAHGLLVRQHHEAWEGAATGNAIEAGFGALAAGQRARLRSWLEALSACLPACQFTLDGQRVGRVMTDQGA